MDRRALLGSLAAALTATACSPDRRSGAAPSVRVPAPRTPSAAPSGSAPAHGGRPARAAAWRSLGGGLDGWLVLPGDADYATARQLYNTRFDGLRPAAVAYTEGLEDIRECLRFARAHRIPVAVRNGGHSYGGWSSGDGRLIIDVSPLDSVTPDGRDAAEVGAGARIIDLYRGLDRVGRTVPAGSCASVGVTGLTLGGGHGVTSRAYGLTCDNLTAATIVTAEGRVREVSAEREPGLFWALRGAGGGNFGVVTALRFRTHPAPEVIVGYLSWPWSRAAAVLTAWQRWAPDLPDEIWSGCHLAAGPGGEPTLSVAALSLGTESGLRDAVDRLADRAGASATSVSLRPRPHLDAMLGYAGCGGLAAEQCALPGALPGRSRSGVLPRETYASASGFFDRELPAAGVRALITAAERFTRLPAGRAEGAIQLTALGGAVNRVDPRATAFVHRRSRVLAQYTAAWAAGTAGRPERAWLRGTHAALRGWASGAAYQNYPDAELRDWRRAYYGPATARLARLKARYDPERVFDFPQAL
ncbi:FAD-binding oxidoreductase [Streptomyces qinzhouensis]|uniref:FAD-binding oxidoreductase n=1 Tax=Streptomyces qinzhouensis TaxID=2599401 RepID=A0A5B8JB07_9ACTN|nr:FAD-binding oxidoreductase [Streptomyces qinzhouensis]QDY77634.1 FAD-binding oxidoreductase [Streptomyces qinzhouensis]